MTHADGATVLNFNVPRSYLTQFTNGDSSVNFIYAYGEEGSSFDLSYHGPRRGSFVIPDFASVSLGQPTSSPPPSSVAPVDVSFANAGVRLQVTLVESGTRSLVELHVHKEVLSTDHFQLGLTDSD